MSADSKRDEALVAQLTERFQNVIGTVNRMRARHLESARLENILTQLEDAVTRIENGQDYSYAERDVLDFHMLEGSPLEGDTALEQELYSLKNILEKLATSGNYISLD